jgi:hypothetical protein
VINFAAPFFIQNTLAGVEGFEPSNGASKGRCLTAWLHPKGVNIVIVADIL